jgi:hypothetical protein
MSDATEDDSLNDMSSANGVIKQAAIDWFDADWRRAAGFGGYVLQQLEASGYEIGADRTT